MGILNRIFKKVFRKELKQAGEELPSGREIEEVVKAADNIFITEKGEKSLFSNEAGKIQELCDLAASLIGLYKKHTGDIDPEVKVLLNLFLYLRSHTINKLNSLRRIHKDAVIIISEAKKCEKYDKIIQSITLSRDPKYRRAKLGEKLKELGLIISIMKDIEDRAEDIDKTMKFIQSETENMRLILKGKYKEAAFKKVKPLPELLKHIKAACPVRPVAILIVEIQNFIRRLDEILENEITSFPLLYENIRKIEIRERRVLKLMRQTGLKAA